MLDTTCSTETEKAYRERKRVPGFPDYEVCESGRVFSLKKGYAVEMKQTTNDRGYKFLSLCRTGEIKTRLVHCLVLETFVGPRPHNHQCRHLNGVRDDNRLENLAWGTQAENCADKKKHGTASEGSRHPDATIDEKTAGRIKGMLLLGIRPASVAAMLRMERHIVANIHHGKTWKDVEPIPVGLKFADGAIIRAQDLTKPERVLMFDDQSGDDVCG